ncbi:hypothetical protein BRC61_06400, partial [Halobacteriales archaeon QH_10_65_19]
MRTDLFDRTTQSRLVRLHEAVETWKSGNDLQKDMPENDDEAPSEGEDTTDDRDDVAEMYGAPGGRDGDRADGKDTMDSDGTDNDKGIGANLDAPVLG